MRWKKRNLTLVAGTVGGDFLDDASIDEMCKTIDEIAALLKDFPEAKYIVLLPSMYTDLETGEYVMNPQLTEEQWDKYCKNVHRAADHVAKYGLIGTFHPHVDCHVQTEAQIKSLLEHTNVQLCLDTGHQGSVSGKIL